jgi:hypothetical protein
MKPSNIVVWLVWLIVALALVATCTGLFYQDGGNSFAFTTVRGETVQIYGQGLYHYDTPIIAVGNKAGDAVTLVLGIPLLVVSILLYRGGSLKGGLLLSGALAYMLYFYGSTAFGTAYNNLFIVYIALVSASLFAFVLVLTSIDLRMLPLHLSPRLPQRPIAIYLVVSGAVLMLVWLILSVIPALLQGKAPAEVWSYTTIITIVVDEAFVAPALILSGVLLLRRTPSGYLLAPTLLVFTVVLGINLTGAGIVQLLGGLVTIGQFIGFTAGFSLLTLFAFWFAIVFFRNISDTAAKT